MRKSIFRRTAVLLTAVCMAFFCFGCGDGKTKTGGDAIGSAASAMEKAERFTVKANAVVSSPRLAQLSFAGISLGVDTATIRGDARVQKTESGYDYVVENGSVTPSSSLPVSVPLYLAKVGNVSYLSRNAWDWDTSFAVDADVSAKAIAEKIGELTAGKQIGDFERDGNAYVVSDYTDYGAQGRKAQEFLRLHGDEPLSAWAQEGTSGTDAAVAAIESIAEALGAPVDGETVRAAVLYAQTLLQSAQDITLSNLVDAAGEVIEEELRRALSYIGDLSAVEGNIIGRENIALYTFGENSVAVRLTLNEDMTVRNFSLGIQADVTYGAAQTQIVKASVASSFAFSYTATAAVSEPSGAISPCILGDDTVMLSSLTGGWSASVYEGKMYTVGTPRLENAAGEPIDGASYQNGKLTLTAQAAEALKEAYGGTLTLPSSYGARTSEIVVEFV